MFLLQKLLLQVVFMRKLRLMKNSKAKSFSPTGHDFPIENLEINFSSKYISLRLRRDLNVTLISSYLVEIESIPGYKNLAWRSKKYFYI